MERLGKSVVIIGAIIVLAGVVIWLFGDKLRFLGRLPGDIRIEREHFKVFIPITTMILVSVVLSLILWLIQRFKG
ncbi:DUF2905 domain-containing protein [Polluticoccus soli]|uniref:DUF2905 domain-containing protein n=1 Tax=Polluticoccus soli TaxID=3034150 RepID=UPI0023E1B34A|nr:DUF2905 domain-containing protein [Flavipsychrobacter sp. JY13-12]